MNWLLWLILAVAVILVIWFYLKSIKKGTKQVPPEAPTSEGPEEPRV